MQNYGRRKTKSEEPETTDDIELDVTDDDTNEEKNQFTGRSLLDSFIEHQKHIQMTSPPQAAIQQQSKSPLSRLSSFIVPSKPSILPTFSTAPPIPRGRKSKDSQRERTRWNNVMIQMSTEFGTELEDFFIELSTCYQLYGCPAHIIEINMPKVAKGLGFSADLTVFPTFQLASFVHTSESGKLKRSTQFFSSSYGLDMYKLQLVDELVRRISSYATTKPPKKTTKEEVDNVLKKRRLSETSISKLLEKLFVIEQGQDSSSVPSTPRIPRAVKTVPKAFNLDDHDPARYDSNTEIPIHSFNPSQSVVVTSGERSPVNEEQKEAMKQTILNLASYGTGMLGTVSAATEAELAISGDNEFMNKLPEPEPEPAEKIEISKDDFMWKYYKLFIQIAVEDGVKNIGQIMKSPPLYNHKMKWFFNGLASAGCCGLFFGGNWFDILFSLIAGFLVSAIGNFSTAPNFIRIYEVFSAFLASLLIRLIHRHVVPLCYTAVALSSVIWLLQGTTITLSIVDVLTRKLVTGTVRLFYGIVISAIIGFGLDLGTSLFAQIEGISKADALLQTQCGDGRGIFWGWYPLLLLLATTSFNMLIDAHYKQLLPMTVVAVLSYLVSYFLTPVLGTNAGSVLSSFTTSLTSSAYARWSGNPGIIYTMSGLMLLVPGSLAVTGFFSFLQNDVAGGIGIVIDVLMVALSLSIGLFLGSLLIVQDDLLSWFHRLQLVEENVLHIRRHRRKRARQKSKKRAKNLKSELLI